MVTTSTQVWTGNSGKTYTYEVYPINGPFPSAPGNYIFAKENPSTWIPLYIGQSGDLRDRLTPITSHEKYPCAKARGITHVHVHVNYGGEQARLAEERDLIARWNPPCNG